MSKKEILNIAVIAHVDAGKSTLVDAILSQTGVFRDNEEVVAQVMDSNDLERERGITIYSKNCAVEYKGVKINVVDTPGHADFSSEVERIMKTVDSVILIVDSSEGPMPQTRVVLQKSLQQGHRPILFINKIDKPDQRAEDVVDMTFDLFGDLGANDEQLDFPIVYGIAKNGIAMRDMEEDSRDLSPLFDLILEHVEVYKNTSDQPLQMQTSSLKYDDYLGRMGVARVTNGTLKAGSIVAVAKNDGTVVESKIGKVFVNQGLGQIEVKEAYSGDMVQFSGIAHLTIGDTVCDKDNVVPMETIEIEEPTLSMEFLVNNSPFAGQSGKYVTSRQIRERLDKELETNVGLRVENLSDVEGYKVSGRGELHLSILLESMRREGYELGVSKPQVLMKEEKGTKQEPFEKVIISLPDEFSGSVIATLNNRKGIMMSMESTNGYTRLEYLAPTRSLIGYRSEFINQTRGEGSLEKSFDSYGKHVGSIETRKNGVLISKETGKTMGYALYNLSERGTLFVGPAVEIYEGMIIGQNSRDNDLVVNPIKNKQLTNVRASGSDDAIKLVPPRLFTLEEALEFIESDELVEITPAAIRIRKKYLDEKERKRMSKHIN